MTRISRRPPRGAALLLALLILVLVATLTAAMVWQQRQAVQVEAAERARTQANWILAGALDWARLILREDGRVNRQRAQPFDALTEPWATPLAEARLSSFLAADQANTTETDVEAFISGQIADAQSRYNLRNLIDGSTGRAHPDELATLERLCQYAGTPTGTAQRIAEALRLAWMPVDDNERRLAPLPPTRLAELARQGLEPALLAQLAPWLDLLPRPTPVNANTASREVLAAVVPGLELGGAERIVQQRQRQPFETLDALRPLLPTQSPAAGTPIGERLSVATAYFEVVGRLRLDERIVEQRSLLVRQDDAVSVVRSERVNLVEALRR
ncbi:MAG: type II secretion system minor pseudopilin GspK [Rubrivivax sp.]|jgi:general secretion pathway protein K|nr:type II secretion system minor pseudopilin GspK [Rubrivivax sp.]